MIYDLIESKLHLNFLLKYWQNECLLDHLLVVVSKLKTKFYSGETLQQ